MLAKQQFNRREYVMYTISDFNNERKRLVLESFLSPETVDFTLLREIYQDLCVFDEALQYNPEDSDTVFWDKANQYSKQLLQKSF